MKRKYGSIHLFWFWLSRVHRDFEDAAFSDGGLTGAAKLSRLLHCFIYFDTSVLICTLLPDCTWSKSHVKVLTNLSQNVLITPGLLSTAARSFADELMGQRSSPFCSLATPFLNDERCDERVWEHIAVNPPCVFLPYNLVLILCISEPRLCWILIGKERLLGSINMYFSLTVSLFCPDSISSERPEACQHRAAPWHHPHQGNPHSGLWIRGKAVSLRSFTWSAAEG